MEHDIDTVGDFEAKTHLSALLARVQNGEEILITRRGKAVARLVPAEAAARDDLRDLVTRLKANRSDLRRRRGQQAAEGKAIADQMLGRLEAQPMLRLEIEHLELQDGVERRPTAPRPAHPANRFIQNRPEQLEVDDLLQLLERIALRRKLPQPILDAPKSALARQWLAPSLVRPVLA